MKSNILLKYVKLYLLSILKEISHPFLIEQGVATPCSIKIWVCYFLKDTYRK